MSSNYLIRDSFVTLDTVPTQQLHSPRFDEIEREKLQWQISPHYNDVWSVLQAPNNKREFDLNTTPLRQ